MFKPSKEKVLIGTILFSIYTITFYIENFSTVYSLLPFLVVPSFWLGIVWVINFHDLKRYESPKVKKRIGCFLWIKFILFFVTNILFHFELINLNVERNNYWFYLYVIIASVTILAIDIYTVQKKPDF